MVWRRTLTAQTSLEGIEIAHGAHAVLSSLPYIMSSARTDLLLPATAEITVHVGDVVKGDETMLAFLKEPPGA